MDSERWRRIETLYQAALAVEPDSRAAFLEQSCSGQESLRQEVESLLFHGENAGRFLEDSPVAAESPMAIQPGAKLGSFEILGLLGKGGMGQVYRAYDTKLRREVALKVISTEHLADPESKRRLLREARAASALNHPNIVMVYEIGSEGGMDFIAMELVEGRSLHEVIPPEGLPLAGTLDYAVQIANGLEKAHAAGIVHRDLKPGNIMVTQDGLVKLVDFGLARRVRVPESATAATLEGRIGGTPAYMSPEQAQGEPGDACSDVFSFGAVLYQMLTGRQLFSGDSTASVLAAVLREEPGWDALPAATPPAVRRLLRLCLRKDRRKRLQSIGDAPILLEEAEEGAPPVSPAANSVLRRWLWPGVSAALAALLLAAGLRYLRAPAAQSVPARLSFTAPPGVFFNDLDSDHLAVSPDGTKLAFTARNAEGKKLVWVRPVDSTEAKPLHGTDHVVYDLFWSPDSRSIAYSSRGKLKRVDLDDGNNRELCDAPRLVGGSWSKQDVIVFAPDYNKALLEVPAAGGTPSPATVKDAARGDVAHTFPVFLPDGRHFVFRVGWGREPGIYLGTLGSMQVKRLVPDFYGCFAPPDSLLFLRNGALLAQRLDVSQQELTGEPATIVAQAGQGRVNQYLCSASDDGVLVWKGAWLHDYQLVWRDREGRPVGAVGPVERLSQDGLEPRLSPEGKRVVFRLDMNRGRDVNLDQSIWVAELDRDAPVELGEGRLPAWSPDGKRAVFVVTGTGRPVAMDASGVGQPETLLLPAPGWAGDFSPDGRFFLGCRRSDKTRIDVWAAPLFGDRKPYPLLNSPGDELTPRFSHDGRWLAYTSDESGSYEVYIRSFTPEWPGGIRPQARFAQRRLSTHLEA